MKSLIICADGTWQSPESEHASHILRLAEGIAPQGEDGRKQVVFYDWGVGSDANRLLGGALGVGLDKNIMDCYRFIVHNYEVGDRLYLFGFSRGAYTVRSLAGLIRNSGILRREYADRVDAAYRLYRQRGKASAPSREKARAFRAAHAVADISRIHFLGVLDTVGALGIPAPFLGTLGSTRYLFHDTEPGRHIDYARHAVAIDENRQDFEPTLWRAKDGIDLQQVWFAGAHTDIGGGYADRSLGDHAGHWLASEAQQCGLALAPHFLEGLSPDYRAPLHNEYRGFYRVLRRHAVREVEPVVHASAKARWLDPDVKYPSPALRTLLDGVGGDWARVEVVEDSRS